MKKLSWFLWPAISMVLILAVCTAEALNDDLCDAIAKKDVQKVVRLISGNIDVNTKDSKGQAPLMIAANKGYIEIAKLLIEKGADVNIKSNGGDTPLISAMSGNYNEIECLVLETPLMSKQLAAATMPLAGKGGSVDEKSDNDQTSLIEAECHDPTQITKLLVDSGADINARDSNGRTPLMIASIKGYTSIIKLLISKGADVNIKSNKGETALSLARANNNSEILSLLNKAGAK